MMLSRKYGALQFIESAEEPILLAPFHHLSIVTILCSTIKCGLLVYDLNAGVVYKFCSI
jgi:hypothetical protein